MPPLGPNFTRVVVGDDGNGNQAIIVDGVSEEGRTDMTIDITWADAGAVAARRENAEHELVAGFDPGNAVDWTVPPVTGADLPAVGSFVVLTGRATMANGAEPPFISWSQTLDVEKR